MLRLIPQRRPRLAALTALAMTLAAISGSTAEAGEAALARRSPLAGEFVELIPPPFTQSFGDPVVLDGDTAAVGSVDFVRVYERDAGGPGAWGEVAAIEAPGGDAEDFPSSAAIDGDVLAVGARMNDDLARDAGAVYLFERNAGGPDNWGLVATLTAADGEEDDWFGGAVALGGDTLVVGAENENERANSAGAAYVFEPDDSGQWGQVAKLTAANATERAAFGTAAAIDGDMLLVGAPGDTLAAHPGAVYAFERNEGQWLQTAELGSPEPASDDHFGARVALAAGVALVSEDHRDEGWRVNRFERMPGDSGEWLFVERLTAVETLIEDDLGSSLAIDGVVALVGAPGDRASRGSASVFARDAGGADSWSQAAQLVAPDGGALGGRFGESVALSRSTVLVGSPGAFVGFSKRGTAYILELRSLGPFLQASGECPGTVRVELSAAAPNSKVLLAGSFAEGSFILPGGPCAGTELGLDSPRLLRAFTTDALGNLGIELDLGGGPCGAHLQALVPSTCLPSNVDRLPQPRSVVRYDPGTPNMFQPSRRTPYWIGNVFDTSRGDPLAGGSLSAVAVYVKRGFLGDLAFSPLMALFPYPSPSSKGADALELFYPSRLQDQAFNTYVLASPVAVPSRFMVGQLLYIYRSTFEGYEYSAGSIGMHNGSVLGQGHHAFEMPGAADGQANGLRRLNRNALIRARGGFGADPLLPVELMKPALPE